MTSRILKSVGTHSNTLYDDFFYLFRSNRSLCTRCQRLTQPEPPISFEGVSGGIPFGGTLVRKGGLIPKRYALIIGVTKYDQLDTDFDGP